MVLELGPIHIGNVNCYVSLGRLFLDANDKLQEPAMMRPLNGSNIVFFLDFLDSFGWELMVHQLHELG